MKLKYLGLLICCLLFTKVVYATDIKNINMDIYVDNNGDAHIKEVWNIDVTNGTEVYKPYFNLGESKIINYEAKMNNIPFTTLNNWNIDASFTDKSSKAGLHKTENGIELCMGVTKYGLNTYEMDYTITNFVVSTTDADMIDWTLIPKELSDAPDKVYIKIYSDFKYSSNIPVWGYGNYGGTAYVYDGYIELNNEDELESNEYMTVLIKFPKGTFNTSVSLDDDFNYYYGLAQEGATSYSEPKESFFEKFMDFILTFFDIILNFGIFIIVGIASVFAAKNASSYGTKKLIFNKGVKKVKDAPYFRDLPCNKDIFEAYWVACQFNLVKNKNDFLGAILLKWLKNKNIENVKIDTKKSKSALNPIEIEIYDMMVEASNDGILEDYEFTSWCKKHYSKILKWFNEAIDDMTMKFVEKGLIREEQKTFSSSYLVDDSMHELGMQMAGLKNFLNDFSNIKDRESIEVNLWEEYLMYAQIFGIAEKVAKEFKNLYPDIITDDYYNDVIFIHTISYNGVHAASVARSQAESRARSYSSGGGGFSSGGGGGGSFGGGGGGGGVR